MEPSVRELILTFLPPHCPCWVFFFFWGFCRITRTRSGSSPVLNCGSATLTTSVPCLRRLTSSPPQRLSATWWPAWASGSARTPPRAKWRDRTASRWEKNSLSALARWLPAHVLNFLRRLLHPGVEEPEAEAGRELPEDHVLPGSPLPDVHAAEDAKHGPGHGGKSERPAPRPLQVSQRDEGPARLPDLQIRHVLPEELKKT